MWKVHGLPWRERRIYHTLTSFSVFPFFRLLQLLECLSGYMCNDNLTMKFPPDFHNYTWLNGLVNSFLWFTIAPPNELILGCKLHWSVKTKKKNSIMWEMVAREIPVRQSLSNTVKSFHAVRLATFLKKDLLSGVSEQAVCRSSRK